MKQSRSMTAMAGGSLYELFHQTKKGNTGAEAHEKLYNNWKGSALLPSGTSLTCYPPKVNF